MGDLAVEQTQVGDLQTEVTRLKKDVSSWKSKATRLGKELVGIDDMAARLKRSLAQAEG